jgi:regulator of replication initiation timing
MVTKFDTTENEAEGLRERMRLLQRDRRANVDLLESKQASNIEEIRCFRVKNKALRTRIAQLQMYLNVNDGNQNEVDLLKRELVSLRMEFDSLKVESARCSKQLDKLRDELQLCDVEASNSHDDDPISSKIRTLENRYVKGMYDPPFTYLLSLELINNVI